MNQLCLHRGNKFCLQFKFTTTTMPSLGLLEYTARVTAQEKVRLHVIRCHGRRLLKNVRNVLNKVMSTIYVCILLYMHVLVYLG